MQNYKKLDIWLKSYSLSLRVYNIAEGAGRATNKDFAHFIQISIGSANEVECELMLARDLGYIETNQFKTLSDQLREVRIMLISFRKSLIS